MRLPIAALLVGIGWGTQAAAQQRAVPAPAGLPPPDVYVHTTAPRDTLIAVSRRLLAEPRRWPRALRWAAGLTTPRPAPGRDGGRIVIVNAEGTEGRYGPVQAFDVAPLPARSWWWLLEPIAVLAAFPVAG